MIVCVGVCGCACVRACVRACVCVCVFITKPPAVMTPLTLRCIELARSPSMPPPRSRSGSRDAPHACSDAAFTAAARTTGDSTARLKSKTSDPLRHAAGMLAERQKASAHTAVGGNCGEVVCGMLSFQPPPSPLRTSRILQFLRAHFSLLYLLLAFIYSWLSHWGVEDVWRRKYKLSSNQHYNKIPSSIPPKNANPICTMNLFWCSI